MPPLSYFLRDTQKVQNFLFEMNLKMLVEDLSRQKIHLKLCKAILETFQTLATSDVIQFFMPLEC